MKRLIYSLFLIFLSDAVRADEDLRFYITEDMNYIEIMNYGKLNELGLCEIFIAGGILEYPNRTAVEISRFASGRGVKAQSKMVVNNGSGYNISSVSTLCAVEIKSDSERIFDSFIAGCLEDCKKSGFNTKAFDTDEFKGFQCSIPDQGGKMYNGVLGKLGGKYYFMSGGIKPHHLLPGASFAKAKTLSDNAALIDVSENTLFSGFGGPSLLNSNTSFGVLIKDDSYDFFVWKFYMEGEHMLHRLEVFYPEDGMAEKAFEVFSKGINTHQLKNGYRSRPSGKRTGKSNVFTAELDIAYICAAGTLNIQSAEGMEMLRRIQLALKSFLDKTGRLPDSIEELAQKSGVSGIGQISPLSGKPFMYFGKGLSKDDVEAMPNFLIVVAVGPETLGLNKVREVQHCDMMTTYQNRLYHLKLNQREQDLFDKLIRPALLAENIAIMSFNKFFDIVLRSET